jgi:hypothetical protein
MAKDTCESSLRALQLSAIEIGDYHFTAAKGNHGLFGRKEM